MPKTMLNKSKQSVCLRYEHFELLGCSGEFVLNKIDGEFIWDQDKEDYVWKESSKRGVTGTAYLSSLRECLEYIYKNYWDDLHIGDEDNVVDTFEELKIVAERIEKRMRKVKKDLLLQGETFDFILSNVAKKSLGKGRRIEKQSKKSKSKSKSAA